MFQQLATILVSKENNTHCEPISIRFSAAITLGAFFETCSVDKSMLSPMIDQVIKEFDDFIEKQNNPRLVQAKEIIQKRIQANQNNLKRKKEDLFDSDR